MTPRGIRNNNPGNIRSGERWLGVVGADDAGFCVFDTDEHGIRALAKVLIAYRVAHGLRTLREYITRWAPPSENDTGSYIAAVCAECKAGPDDDYPLTAASLVPLLAAIVRHENGQQPYSLNQLTAGITLALGNIQPAAPVSEADPAHRIVIHQEAPVLPAIIPALLPSIVQMIPAIAQIFGSGSEVSQRNAKAAQVVADTVVAATNSVNLQEAAEKMKADDSARQAAQIAVLAQPDIASLLEVGGGIEAARKAAADPAQIVFWRNPAVLVTAALAPLLYIVVVRVMLYPAEWSETLRAVVVTAIVSGLLGSITGFFLGSSLGSQRKDAVIATK